MSSWEIQLLEQVCDFVGGGTPAKSNAAFYQGDIPWATVRDMKHDSLETTEFRITDEAVKKSSTNIIAANNVVIATRVGLGKVCLVRQATAINQDLRAIIPKDSGQLSVSFLFWWLKSIAHIIQAEGTGATVKGVKLPFVKSLPIPVPSPSEQKRIVAILDEAFAGIDQAIANTERNLANTRELFDSYLNDVFTQTQWVEKTVGEISEHCLGKMLDKNKNKGEFRPYLRNLNVQWFSIDTSDLLEMRIEQNEHERYLVKKGDLLICEGGYPGRAAIWQGDDVMFFQKALHRVRCHKEFHNVWLMYYLFYLSSTGRLSEFFTGAGIQHFTGRSLKVLPVPVGDDLSMTRCIEGIKRIHDELLSLEDTLHKKLGALGELKQSLLQKAFTGELTADWRKQQEVTELFGTIEYDDDYDYKKQRQRNQNGE